MPPECQDRPRIGLIGLGRMGAPMSRQIMAAGLELAVYDQLQEAVERLVAETGATPFDSPAAVAAASDVVVTMLPDGKAVHSVVLGPGGDAIADGLTPGGLVVDMSSASPEETRGLGADLGSLGFRLVDAPVSGGVARATTGTLAVMVGGRQSDIDRARPVFDAVGSVVVECGPLGCGHAAKALNNAVSAAGLIASAEAMLVAQRFGITPQIMLDVLNSSSGRNNSTENKLGQFVLSRTFASGFELGLMVKDLRIALDMAVGTDLPFGMIAQSLLTAGAARGQLGAQVDHTAVVRWLESQAGAELELGPDRVASGAAQ